MKHVILVVNASLGCQVFGTPIGEAFTSEGAATRAKKRFEKRFPKLDAIVLPVSVYPTDDVTAPVG